MRHYTICVICFFLIGRANSQTWQSDPTSKSAYLQHHFYNSYDGVLKAGDSYFIFTRHQPDAYWKKKNRDKSQLVVSKVDSKGDITVVQKLDNYVERSLKKYFNNKFYILSTGAVLIKGKYYSPFFIYNANWQLEKQIFLPESFKHQRGFGDFVVDKNGYIYVTSSPYFVDHHPQDFTGTYLLKSDTSGNFIKSIFYEKSFLEGLELNNDTLSFTAQKQKLIGVSYQTDSLISVVLNKSLDNLKQVALATTKKDNNYLRALTMSNGTKAVFIDSIYHINANIWASKRKIAMLDKNGKRKWTTETPKNFIVSYSTTEALHDGTFVVEIEKKWVNDRVYDTVSLVQFNTMGAQRDIKTFLVGANPGMDRYFISSFFEVKPNEIWLFYRRSFSNSQERVCFERLLLD
jgi:hypothetical protein